MFGDMMSKLQEMKKQMEESKKRLDSITVMGESGGGNIVVVANGNRKITDIKIKEELLKSDKEEIEELLTVAVNRAIEQADKINEAEMQTSAKSFLPGFPGL